MIIRAFDSPSCGPGIDVTEMTCSRLPLLLEYRHLKLRGGRAHRRSPAHTLTPIKDNSSKEATGVDQLGLHSVHIVSGISTRYHIVYCPGLLPPPSSLARSHANLRPANICLGPTSLSRPSQPDLHVYLKTPYSAPFASVSRTIW